MGTMKKRAEAVVPASSTSLMASATRITTKMAIQPLTGEDKEWQRQAYSMYDQVGEFRYACDWVGSMMSKAILSAGKRVGRTSYHALQVKDAESQKNQDIETEGGNTEEEVADSNDLIAAELVEDLFADPDGKSEMLRLIGTHLTIAGECFLIGYDNPDPMDDKEDIWLVSSPLAISREAGTQGKWRVNNETIDVNPDEVMVIRLWRPHPQDPRRAVSPARALIPVLGEILRLTQHVAAQVDSRLAGAGILLMPSEMTFPPPPETKDAEGNTIIHHAANDAESLMDTITEAMSASIQDRGSASALVPIVITAPSDAIDKVKHVTFWSELDRQAIDLRNEAIRRLALGMDMPPEVLQGTADSTHWSAWQADESAIKAHTEPLLRIITAGLSKGYLRPLLLASGVDDVELLRKYTVLADTSEMRLRPNRSKEAMELYDRGALSEESLRRETGFSEDDAMDKDQRATWFQKKIAAGSYTPELVERALVSLDALPASDSPSAGQTTMESGETTREARPAPSLNDHPTRDIPDADRNRRIRERRAEKIREDQGLTASLVAASEQVVIRAFERAGNKLKNKMQTKPRVPAAELYSLVAVAESDTEFLLDDAWAHLPPIAERHSIDPDVLRDGVEGYARESLVAAAPHSYERFEEYLTNYFSELEDAHESV